MKNMNDEISKILFEKLKEQYRGKDIEKIIDGYKAKRFVTLRVNTLRSTCSKMEEELSKNKIQFEKVLWSKDAFTIKNASEKEIQNLECYQKGEIYLQSLSSMLPPILLNPKPGENILDMAAAPGSKTTQIAALSNNEALITACEINKIRAERLKYNIEKQGATSVYIMVTDARKLDDMFSFDKILLDAPCTRKWNSTNVRSEYKTTI